MRLRTQAWLEIQVLVLEQEIERRVISLEEPMARVMTIPGIDRKTVWMIVAELGVDMSVFGDAAHLASWAGLCPGNRESGGKRMSGRTRKANRYVRRGMCQAAWAASHTKDTYLSAFYRRMQVRKGPQKAVLALAHHMISVVYNVLARTEEYVELGGNYYDQQNKPKVVARAVARLKKLGYEVTLTPIAAEETAEDIIVDSQVTASSTEATSTETVPVPKRKRGRPCKCAERGIICKHSTTGEVNSLMQQASSPERFS
jgi:transposase